MIDLSTPEIWRETFEDDMETIALIAIIIGCSALAIVVLWLVIATFCALFL